MPRRIVLFGIVFVMAYLLQALMNDLILLSGMALAGEVLDMLFFQYFIKKTKEKILIEKTADATTSKVEEVLKKYVGNGRVIVAMARSIEADTDKKGNIVSGSRKKKVQTYINSLGLKVAQKYMIMGYLGYSNKNGQQQVKSYIQRLSLTKSEKEKLYEYSGYAA